MKEGNGTLYLSFMGHPMMTGEARWRRLATMSAKRASGTTKLRPRGKGTLQCAAETKENYTFVYRKKPNGAPQQDASVRKIVQGA